MAKENRMFTANFSDQVFTVECSSQPAEGGLTSGCGFYAPGQAAVLIAHSNPGWSFKNWTSNEIVISESDTFNFDVTSGLKVVANFSQNLYVVNCSSNPLDGGVTSGCGFFNYGQTAQLKAIANPGYVFDYWSENDSTISDISNFSFLVNNNKSVTANFKVLTGFTDLTKEDIIPGEYFLANAFPNPFNPSTTIKFGIPMQSSVFMFITNIQGKTVRILLKNQSISAGMYIKRFDGDNLASGIYFVTLIAVDLETNRSFVKSKKLMLIK